jgi:hypothetical protein
MACPLVLIHLFFCVSPFVFCFSFARLLLQNGGASGVVAAPIVQGMPVLAQKALERGSIENIFLTMMVVCHTVLVEEVEIELAVDDATSGRSKSCSNMTVV